MSQLIFNYPKIEVKCEPHIAKLLNRFLKNNNNQILNRNHLFGATLKNLLQPYNSNWDYSTLPGTYTSLFSIYVSESEMKKIGAGLSPANTIIYNNNVDKAFEYSLFHKVESLWIGKTTKKDAILQALEWHGLTDEDFSYEAAHMLVYRYKTDFSIV